MKIKFIQDQECHWYAVPEEKADLFYALEETGEADDWCDFCNEFEQYRIDHPSNYIVEGDFT